MRESALHAVSADEASALAARWISAPSGDGRPLPERLTRASCSPGALPKLLRDFFRVDGWQLGSARMESQELMRRASLARRGGAIVLRGRP
jgi:hypothetical protein